MRHLLFSLSFHHTQFTNVATAELGVTIADESQTSAIIMSLVRRNNILTVKGTFTRKGLEPYMSVHRTAFLLNEEKGVQYFVLKDTYGNPLGSGSKHI